MNVIILIMIDYIMSFRVLGGCLNVVRQIDPTQVNQEKQRHAERYKVEVITVLYVWLLWRSE